MKKETKYIIFTIIGLLALAGLAYAAWYFTTHSKSLKVVSVNKAARKIKTLSPLGKIEFTALDGIYTDTSIFKNKKYEIGYRSNDGNKIEIYLTRTIGLPPLEVATVDLTTGQTTYFPAAINK